MLETGLYEQVIDEYLNSELSKLSELWQTDKKKMDSAESAVILGRFMGRLLTRILQYFDHSETAVSDRVALCNAIIHYTIRYLESVAGDRFDPELLAQLKGHLIHQEAEMLLAILDASRAAGKEPIRPETPLSISSLFTGDKREPSMLAELKKEIATSDRVDFLVSFIKFSGLRLLLDDLRAFAMQGGRLRVITTCYMGATDFKAVQELVELPNTEVKISYDTKTTRLHAKAYLFWRNTGFSTLYIGSSNISESAMTSGLEWNVKLSQQDAPNIVKKVEVTFEHYWNNPEFVTYIPQLHEQKLRQALKAERSWHADDHSALAHYFDIQPYYYQQEILDKLQAEREVHGRHRNLIVAATGNGENGHFRFRLSPVLPAKSRQAQPAAVRRPSQGNFAPKPVVFSRHSA